MSQTTIDHRTGLRDLGAGTDGHMLKAGSRHPDTPQITLTKVHTRTMQQKIEREEGSRPPTPPPRSPVPTEDASDLDRGVGVDNCLSQPRIDCGLGSSGPNLESIRGLRLGDPRSIQGWGHCFGVHDRFGVGTDNCRPQPLHRGC
ncbi:hypothetical protein CRG98_030558 [Punica granatum]|uniref:Uncharacterized protein n=1 Tax=Punica granatum TaxID=22663 RepID=A0A2I0IYH2_PUNGR|nr:hypothetical protein CRG98_030558 [Punica granatum]